jgi:hypothetical protein
MPGGFGGRNLKKRDLSEDLCRDLRIILKWILKVMEWEDVDSLVRIKAILT